MKLFWGKHKIYAGLSVCVLIMMASAAWGQPPEQLTINYIEAAPLPGKFLNQVRAYVTVSSAGQEPILGLAANNFEALEDGQKVKIDSVAKTTDPMAVVLAIDTSGSMLAKDKSGRTSMDAAKSAAISFISLLDKNDRVALFSFNNEPTLHLDFSSDHGDSIRTVKTLKAKYNAATCLYDTTFEAVKKAAEIPKGRRAIILLTDGRDERAGRLCSTHNVNDVIDAATTKSIRVPIYTVGVGPKVDAKELGRIASFTGGRSLLAASIKELDGFYQTLASQLKNQYVVKYGSQTPSGEHSLVIKVRKEKHMSQDEKRFWSPPLPVLPPPSVRFVSPVPTGQEEEAVTIKVNINPAKTVAKVRYYEDAVLKAEYTSEPFDTFKWDIPKLTAGLHVLRVEVVDIKGQLGSAEITHKVKAPLPPQPVLKPTESIPAAKEETGNKTIIMLLVGIILLGAVGGVIICRQVMNRKKKDAETLRLREIEALSVQPEEREEIDEDETIYVSEVGEEEKTQVTQKIKAPAASITVIKSRHFDPKQRFDISGTTVIGRSTDNNITIPDKSVSRKHAEIYLDGDTYYARDLGSKYGTNVNEQSITLARTALKDGDQIQLGPKTILQFHLQMPEEEMDDNELTKKYGFEEDEKTLVRK